MPLINYIPLRDEDLRAWANNFSTLITATPAAFGLTAPQAAAYAALYATYNTSLTTATNPATRTKPTVAAKDSARASLELTSRDFANIVQAFPTITPEQLAALGLTVRTTTRTPVPAPTTAPILGLQNLGVLSADLRFSDETTPDLRAKPFGVWTCEVWVKFGSVPPVSVADCQFLVDASRNPSRLAWPPSQAGETAWLLGRWKTRRGLVGPPSATISTTIVGGA